jgi:hypothetical protein
MKFDYITYGVVLGMLLFCLSFIAAGNIGPNHAAVDISGSITIFGIVAFIGCSIVILITIGEDSYLVESVTSAMCGIWLLFFTLIILSVGIVTEFWYVYIIALFATAEVIFIFFDKSKPDKKDSVFWFTAKQKTKGLVEAGAAVLILNFLAKGGSFIFEWVSKNLTSVIQSLQTIGVWIAVVALVIGVSYAYIRLNSLKYRR